MKIKKCLLICMFFISTIVFVAIFLPVLTKMDDSVNLGDKYLYIQDYPQAIISYETDEYKGIGHFVVPPIIIDYNFNNEFIIAITKDLEVNDIIYWIVDKKTQIVEQFSDRLDFYHTLNEKNVDLGFD
ncbi:hypothetical protein [Bacteroides sp. 519]|uniref:hypothetical protein n=1 Tax=Bacteroides sp. 519 TaxID=2302937 RepID=UPI0013D85482|nr:hypothetical protein [Bacteroides sp. 519]NDV58063.1 hypothetical protein [Bacteroides sp. 519]